MGVMAGQSSMGRTTISTQRTADIGEISSGVQDFQESIATKRAGERVSRLRDYLRAAEVAPMRRSLRIGHGEGNPKQRWRSTADKRTKLLRNPNDDDDDGGGEEYEDS